MGLDVLSHGASIGVDSNSNVTITGGAGQDLLARSGAIYAYKCEMDIKSCTNTPCECKQQ